MELPSSDEEQRREGAPARGGIGRRVRGGNRYEELYDLRRDPLEEVNLIDDPACQTALAELRDRLDELRGEAASARGAGAD